MKNASEVPILVVYTLPIIKRGNLSSNMIQYHEIYMKYEVFMKYIWRLENTAAKGELRESWQMDRRLRWNTTR